MNIVLCVIVSETHTHARTHTHTHTHKQVKREDALDDFREAVYGSKSSHRGGSPRGPTQVVEQEDKELPSLCLAKRYGTLPHARGATQGDNTGDFWGLPLHAYGI